MSKSSNKKFSSLRDTDEDITESARLRMPNNLLSKETASSKPIIELAVFNTVEEQELAWANETELDAYESEEEAEEFDAEENGEKVVDVDAPLPGHEHVHIVPATPAVTKALHERHHFEFMVIVIGGAALAFNAGFVNGCTYQLGNIPVSHITGTTTKAGLQLGNGDFQLFAVSLCLISCYVFGAGITGFMMKQETFQLGREYGPLFIIGSMLFLVACLAIYYAPQTNLFFYFAAMACGLQNGLTTKYSGSIIRTTHMTGAGTDIGLVLGRIAQGDTKERWKLFVLVPLFTMFLFGGVMSVHAVRKFGELSLLINVAVFSSIGIAYSIIVGQELHIPFWRALFGSYVIVETKVIEGQRKARKAVKNVVDKVKNPMHY